MYYTYVLQSQNDKKFYIGFTADLKKRVLENNKGLVSSTKSRRPFNLIYYEACPSSHDAVYREKYFKTGFGRRFLNNRLKDILICSGSRWRAGKMEINEKKYPVDKANGTAKKYTDL